MIAFTVAAKAADLSEDEDVVEVPIEDKVYLARRLTPGMAVQLAMAREGTLGDMYQTMWLVIHAMMGQEAVDHLQRLIWERRIDINDIMGGSDQNEKGLINQLQEEFGARPTKPSTDSSSSQAPGGRKSTARSRGKGSIHGDSASTGS